MDRQKNIILFERFFNRLVNNETELRQDRLRYPELKEYRKGGKRAYKHIPCWAAFSYFEMGTIENIFKFLRSDLRKEVLLYGYTRGKYGKNTTIQMDTWLNGIRILRNICAHNSKLVGMKAAIVLPDYVDEPDILISREDLFSRIYALKKVLMPKDSDEMKKKISSLIKKTKVDVYQLNILPTDWEDKFDRINYL